MPGLEEYRFRINEYHELSCLTVVGRGLGDCARFKKNDKTIPKAGTGKYNISTLDWMCGMNMYRPGYGSYGYNHRGQPCNKALPQFFDKWHCKDFHDMDIAVYLSWDKALQNDAQRAENKRLYCASFDNESCATFKNQSDCKKIGSQFGVYKLSMGHQGAFKRTEADTLSGKMFVLHHNVQVNRWKPLPVYTDADKVIQVGKNKKKAVSAWRGNRRGMGMFYDYQKFLEFEIPNNLNYMRFKIVSSSSYTVNWYLEKLQVALLLDGERILGQLDKSLQRKQMKYQFEFKGIAKDIKKGKHTLSFRAANAYAFYFEAGEIQIDILGYY